MVPFTINFELGRIVDLFDYSLDVFGQVSTRELYMQAMSLIVPKMLLSYLKGKAPNPRLQTLVDASVVATGVAKSLIAAKSHDATSLDQPGSHDVMSLLGKSCPKIHLAIDELNPSISTSK